MMVCLLILLSRCFLLRLWFTPSGSPLFLIYHLHIRRIHSYSTCLHAFHYYCEVHSHLATALYFPTLPFTQDFFFLQDCITVFDNLFLVTVITGWLVDYYIHIICRIPTIGKKNYIERSCLSFLSDKMELSFVTCRDD